MRRVRRQIHSKFLFCMGVVVLSVGLGAAYFGIWSGVARYIETRGWQQVEATLHTLELESNSGDTTTYRVAAQYSYVVDDVEFTNTRVALQNSFDNIDKFWPDLYQELRRQKSRNDVYAWVNPNDPTQAVLNRHFRWPMVIVGVLFLSVFGSGGAVMIWLSMRPEKSKSEIISSVKSGITSDEANSSKFAFLVGLLFFVVGTGFSALLLPTALADGEYAALFVLIFVVVGAVIMFFGWRSYNLYQDIGKTLLFLDPVPGAIGGQVGGYFDIDAHVGEAPMQIRLTCYEDKKSGEETYRSIIWQEINEPYSKRRVDETRVIFVFDVPGDLPKPQRWSGGRYIGWTVECLGTIVRGQEQMPLSRSWSIPLKKSAQISRVAKHIPAEFIQAQEKAKLAAAKSSAAEQIDVGRVGDDFMITSDAGRRIGFSLNLAGTGTFFAVLGLFLARSDWFLGYFFFLIGAPFAIIGLFLIGRKITVIANPRERMVFMGRSWFKLPLYTKRIAYSDPAQFSVLETLSMSSGPTKTVYHALYLENNGKKVKLAEGIKGEDAANALLDDLLTKLF